LDKRISAAFVTMLFILGIVAMPVSAHFTMGNHQATYPFRNRHFDPHVDGLIGYVFPGGGLFTAGAPGWYTGAGTYPGYQSPWPYWTGGVNNPWPSQGPMGWYQLDANNYAPFGAILTSTIKAGTPFTTMWKANRWASDNPTIEGLPIEHVEHAVKGDLVLAFNVTKGQKDAWRRTYPSWYAVNFTFAEIMIPPEFAVGLTRTKVVASYTNNYDNIAISTRSREDYAYLPYWRRLRVFTDTHAFLAEEFRTTATEEKLDDAPDSWLDPAATANPSALAFSPWKTFGNITFVIRDSATMGNVDTDEWFYIRINDVTAPTIAGAYHFKFRRLYGPGIGSVFFPPANWPVILVKGEVDPAIITGTIRYGGWNTAYYGLPIELPGRVRAVGIADDPYTGKSTGRPVEARGYFDRDWRGHYEIEGVAPGVYDIYASAAGYPEIKIASNVKILKGQSYHIDGYLTPGVQIKGTVFSKCGTGEVPWGLTGSEANIKIEIYRSLEEAAGVEAAATSTPAVTWSPIGYGIDPWANWKFQWSPTPGGTAVMRGVGPPPSSLGELGWQVTSTRASYTFQFGEKGVYGAVADLVGHVPGHRDAQWVSGLGAGTYWVRAWIYGYVQTLADGVTFESVSFTVPSVEWPGDVWIPFDIRRSSWVKKTVHFHDVPGTLVEAPIRWGHADRWDATPGYWRYLAAELVDAKDKRHAWKADPVDVTRSNYDITIRGFKETGTWYRWGRNYGIPAGLYTVKAYMWGYVEQVFEKVNIGLCGTETAISDHMYRGAKFNITIYSKDWQHPTVDKYWSFPYMPIYLQIFDEKGKQLTPFWDQYVMPLTMQGYMNTSVAVWPYMWNNPIHMIKYISGRGLVYGPDFVPERNAAYPSSSWWHNYFGPWDIDGDGLRDYYWYVYDGAENYMLYWYARYSYGEGSTIGSKPLAFESGTYSFKALTYGYVQKKPVAMAATKGDATSDILIKLTQGAEFDLKFKFKHQGIFEALPFDATMRIRIIDDKKALVGEYLTSDWWWQPQYEYTTNTLRYTWNLVRTVPPTPHPQPRNIHRDYWRLNYIPAGTTEVTVIIAGLPDMYNWVNGFSPDPFFDMGYEGNKIAAPYGIDAYPNYKGGWTVEVDIVPTGTRYTGPFPLYRPWINTVWYHPVRGLLMGESAKYIPANHLGPYEQRYVVTIPGTHLGGESSLIFELDRRGFVSGQVIGYTWSDDWRSVSWTTVQFTAADGKIYDFYTMDGRFEAWLSAGPYTAAVIFWSPAKQEGYKVQTMPYHVSDGALGAFNVYLEQSGIPIPEFPVAAVVLASALAASLFILRRRKKQ